MKGPYGRLRFDVRRLWQCPVCGRFERSAGSVVALPCLPCGIRAAGAGEVWMKLVEEPPTTPDTDHAGELPREPG